MRTLPLWVGVVLLTIAAGCDTSSRGTQGEGGQLRIQTTSLADTIQESDYSVTLWAAGGSLPYTWELASGTLPGSLTLTSDGVLAGNTMQDDGLFEFRVRLRDSTHEEVEADLTLLVHQITEIPLLLLDDKVETPTSWAPIAFSHALTVVGGEGERTFSIVDGQLPEGFALSPAGTISGTTSGDYTGYEKLVIRVEDAAGNSHERPLFFGINMPLATPGPGWSPHTTTFVLNHGVEMSVADSGHTRTRFHRAVRDVMRDIAELGLKESWFDELGYGFSAVSAGDGANTVFPDGGINVARKEQAIMLLATLLPKGRAPMFSAMQIAQGLLDPPTATDDRLFLRFYSGGDFGADPAAPGGEATFANVLDQAQGWPSGAGAATMHAIDYHPSGEHQQFMQQLAALGGGTYTGQ